MTSGTTPTGTRNKEMIRQMMVHKDVSPDELKKAYHDLKEMQEKHGDALSVAKVFDDDAIEEVIE